jgi:SP family facilitated glucose transporter-like MFS transporter 8
MVYFTTFIAVCGSYEFGACVSTLLRVFIEIYVISYGIIYFFIILFFQVGYSSPTQEAIRKDLNLSLAEVS